MDDLASGIVRTFRNAGTAQVAVSAAAFAVALGGVIPGRRWYLIRPEGGSGRREAAFELLVVVGPCLLGLLIIAAARPLLATEGQPAAALDTAWLLLVTLTVIRVLVFLLRLSVGQGARIRAWELRVTLVIWVLVAMQQLGWLSSVVAELDSIGLSAGAARITIWFALKALATVSFFVVASLWVARWIDRRVSTVQELAPSTRIGIGKFAYAFLIALGVLLGLQASGVDLTALTVLSGAIGLGLGFGLQSIAANFVSGIATLVPNQNVITNPLINWSYGHPKVRLRLPVRISYQDDVELALKPLPEAAEHPRILRDPPAVSRLMEFTDFGMEIELRFWIDDPAEGVNNVRSDVNRRIWAKFREHGITIPPAQRELRILEGSAPASRPAPRTTQPIDPTRDGQD